MYATGRCCLHLVLIQQTALVRNKLAVKQVKIKPHTLSRTLEDDHISLEELSEVGRLLALGHTHLHRLATHGVYNCEIVSGMKML